jgi:hypothetical protein
MRCEPLPELLHVLGYGIGVRQHRILLVDLLLSFSTKLNFLLDRNLVEASRLQLKSATRRLHNVVGGAGGKQQYGTDYKRLVMADLH